MFKHILLRVEHALEVGKVLRLFLHLFVGQAEQQHLLTLRQLVWSVLDARPDQLSSVAVEVLSVQLMRRVDPVLLGAYSLDHDEQLLVNWLSLILSSLHVLLLLIVGRVHE